LEFVSLLNFKNFRTDCEELAKHLEKTMGPIMATTNQRDFMEDFMMESNMNDVSWNGTEY
jgi:hypothetical protein